MATKNSQRIGIWVIAIAMVAGTLGGFLVMVLAPQNQAGDQARFDTLSAEFQKENEAYQTKISERDDRIAATLSEQHFSEFNQLVSRVAAFDAGAVTELKKEDLVVGDGEDLGDDSKFAVYYMGWNPKGKMFDSSFSEDKTALGMPLIHQSAGVWMFAGDQAGGVIDGWTEGIKGMKLGGVRELTIPSELAYGDQARGEDIPADTPLKFILMTIAAPNKGESTAQPQMSKELQQLYMRLYNVDPNMLGGM